MKQPTLRQMMTDTIDRALDEIKRLNSEVQRLTEEIVSFHCQRDTAIDELESENKRLIEELEIMRGCDKDNESLFNDIERSHLEINRLKGFIEGIVTIGGQYPELNNMQIVADAYKVLSDEYKNLDTGSTINEVC